MLAALLTDDFTAGGFVDVAEQDADFALYDTEESKKPAGEFAARFTLRLTAARGNPYTA